MYIAVRQSRPKARPNPTPCSFDKKWRRVFRRNLPIIWPTYKCKPITLSTLAGKMGDTTLRTLCRSNRPRLQVRRITSTPLHREHARTNFYLVVVPTTTSSRIRHRTRPALVRTQTLGRWTIGLPHISLPPPITRSTKPTKVRENYLAPIAVRDTLSTLRRPRPPTCRWLPESRGTLWRKGSSP